MLRGGGEGGCQTENRRNDPTEPLVQSCKEAPKESKKQNTAKTQVETT